MTAQTSAPTANRWVRFARKNLPLLAVFTVVLVAVVFVLADRWRRGAFVFGLATLLAAGFRLCLPTERVGLLAVRGQRFDVGALTAVGAAIVWLAVSIDPLGTD
ncbi:hypothetical protein ABIC28_000444 [Rhodococcus sp. PvR044]|uniref:DUF3017 domain-containing protein n=1 Tax=Rhodococcus TaxID=1827 RepID=UPI000BD008B0|nr:MULTISPECIES: DUF3017 domain-containing protein [Rhodococcus]MBP1162905.1 hypothetical protein [Rhodococcus sp. PvR099]MCZ4554757.1 DUF3017 domain-containing protein [Rhodococcus maanshanensis]PTR44272.1 Protein of unknown function (DUF3017) [Rhodococcus sp. OK611]SNX89713.1 Protein of unknown function [Rhodococcus sp. OK270]